MKMENSTRSFKIPDDIEIIKNVEYGRAGGRPLKMDVLRPKRLPDKPMPVVIWIHGGGWRAGSKEAGIPLLIPFAQNGYFCVTIEYQLSKEAKFPAQIEDCKCAVRYLRANAKEYNIDPGKLGVGGSSAGGHLAALLGTSTGIEELEGAGGWQGYSSKVQAVCDFFGPTDFLGMDVLSGVIKHNSPGSPESLLIGGPIQENKEKVMKANPVTYINGDESPFLIVHGEKDKTVPISQSELLYEGLRKAGDEATFIKVRGVGHGLRSGFTEPHVIAYVKAFFDKCLKGDDTEWKKIAKEDRKGQRIEISLQK